MCVTPIGKGRIVGGYPADHSQTVLVLYSRKGLSDEEWLLVSPYGGPCRFKSWKLSEIECLE